MRRRQQMQCRGDSSATKRYYKAKTARAFRKQGRLDPENAVRKYRYWGYTT